MTTRRKPSSTLTKILSSMDEDTLRRTRDRMLVASKIADTLKVKNISQKKFAEMLGKTESEISEWLSGDRNFTVDTLSDISNCLGIDLLQLSYSPTIRVSMKAEEIKFPKTRRPVVYDASDVMVDFQSTGGWQALHTSGCLSLVL